jgi:hypothetical protein
MITKLFEAALKDAITLQVKSDYFSLKSSERDEVLEKHFGKQYPASFQSAWKNMHEEELAEALQPLIKDLSGGASLFGMKAQKTNVFIQQFLEFILKDLDAWLLKHISEASMLGSVLGSYSREGSQARKRTVILKKEASKLISFFHGKPLILLQTAMQLDEKEERAEMQKLTERHGTFPEIQAHEGLIGGARILIGGTLIDNSYRKTVNTFFQTIK